MCTMKAELWNAQSLWQGQRTVCNAPDDAILPPQRRRIVYALHQMHTVLTTFLLYAEATQLGSCTGCCAQPLTEQTFLSNTQWFRVCLSMHSAHSHATLLYSWKTQARAAQKRMPLHFATEAAARGTRVLTFANTQLMLALAASSKRLPSPVELSLSPPLQQRAVSVQVLLPGKAAAQAECFEHGHTCVQCLIT